MQIEANSFTQGIPTYKSTAEKNQNSATSFNTLLSLQSNQNANEIQETQEESPQRLWDIFKWDIQDTGSFMAFAGLVQAATLESQRLYGTTDNGYKILQQWLNETDSTKFENILEKSISASKRLSNNGGYLDELGNWSPKPQHIFEAQKAKAIDILSEILRSIKA
ncbi:hypothetical protein LS70_003245 [Helicobacter sp. MIT 11-5569]|uniref:hypothetical protein n=1 Tax=Helicobacter sp. MIT 11-5569 TaxID=1548151 RepID=UPI00051F979B|nr:hypothetical protein [Helicobacter sp. MIT 11-5569]TLD84576.1 hypothetical protein LS70_003245 [Helicobacter sp. MIT 11-5569]